jgi:Restriction endonuclease/TIR domain
VKVFMAYSFRDRDVAEVASATLRDAGHTVYDPFELRSGVDIHATISASIRSAHAVIAIMTPSSANIFYELGLAAGAGVPTLVASSGGEFLPSDLASLPYVHLSGDHARDAQQIVSRLRDLEGLASAPPSQFSSAKATLKAASREPTLLEALSPEEFEELVARLFREQGYRVEVTPDASGVDFTLESQSDRRRVIVQVKKLSRQGRVSITAIRELAAAVTSADGGEGMLIATTRFTAAARAIANESGLILRTLEDILRSDSEETLLSPTLPSGQMKPAEEAGLSLTGDAGEEAAETLRRLAVGAITPAELEDDRYRVAKNGVPALVLTTETFTSVKQTLESEAARSD